MAKEIKIININAGEDVRADAVAEITRLVNDGWVIVTAGGFGIAAGFIVLQKG